MAEPARVPPSAEGFREAWTVGRRRRRAKIASGALSVAAIVFFVGHGGGGGGLISLRPAPAPVAGRDAISPTPSATPSPASPRRGPTGSGLADARASAAPAGPSADPSRPAPSPAGGEGGGPTSPTPSSAPTSTPLLPTRHHYSVSRDQVALVGETSCVQNSPDAESTGWCTQFPGPFSSRSGASQSYQFQVCRLSTAGAGTLHFVDAREAYFTIQSTQPEWSSATGEPAAGAAHDVAVAAGTCARWTVNWDTYDDHGELLPVSDGYTFAAVVRTDFGSVTTPSGSQAFSITP